MRKRLLRPLAYGLVLLIVVLTVVGTVALRHNVADDDRKILDERGAEATALLQSTLQQEITSARVLAQVALADEPTRIQHTFAAGAALIKEQGITALGIARPTRGGFVVRAGYGDEIHPGQVVTGADAAMLRKGLEAVAGSTSLTTVGARTRIGLNIPVGKDVLFLYEDFDPREPIPAGIGPFASLRAAVYASPTPSASTLVMTTEHKLPITGSPVGSSTVLVGDDQWTLVYGENTRLVDALSANMPWFLLGGGLGLAVLVAFLTVTMLRRQSYAARLVAERTRSLTEANLELRQAEAAAEAANRSKSEFLSRMSHELRTPLNSILGYGQILQMDPLRDDQEQPVQQILSSGRHLLDLINEVLDISRIEVGTLSLSVEPVDVTEVLATALDMVRPAARDRSVALVVTSDVAGKVVRADRQRLRQVLINLLTNAVKYNRVDGSVTVSTEPRDGDRLRILVTDTGPGIDPTDFERVFAPFERLAAENSTVEGTGMGLALSRQLLTAMDGEIGLTSQRGQGSTFWVDLPLAEPLPAQHNDQVAPPHAVHDEPARRTVLLVEDNPANVGVIERALSRLGNIHLISASTGHDALSLARTEAPSLVLLDVHLPDISGEQVLRVLRDHPATSGIPVIIVSADATDRQIERLMAAGATTYMTKPIDVRELIDIVSDTTSPTAS